MVDQNSTECKCSVHDDELHTCDRCRAEATGLAAERIRLEDLWAVLRGKKL